MDSKSVGENQGCVAPVYYSNMHIQQEKEEEIVDLLLKDLNGSENVIGHHVRHSHGNPH